MRPSQCCWIGCCGVFKKWSCFVIRLRNNAQYWYKNHKQNTKIRLINSRHNTACSYSTVTWELNKVLKTCWTSCRVDHGFDTSIANQRDSHRDSHRVSWQSKSGYWSACVAHFWHRQIIFVLSHSGASVKLINSRVFFLQSPNHLYEPLMIYYM